MGLPLQAQAKQLPGCASDWLELRKGDTKGSNLDPISNIFTNGIGPIGAYAIITRASLYNYVVDDNPIPARAFPVVLSRLMQQLSY